MRKRGRKRRLRPPVDSIPSPDRKKPASYFDDSAKRSRGT
jgi:hypothetical protein